MKCRHHWMIPAADRGEPLGVCNYCGEQRMFSNDPPGERFFAPTDLPPSSLPLPSPPTPGAASDTPSAALPWLCAWCHPGKGDETTSHGICAEHAWQLMLDYKRRRDELTAQLLEVPV